MTASTLFTAILLSVLVRLVGSQICPESSLSLSTPMKLMKADILLYGKDVTPPPDCRGDTGDCNRRMTQLQVYCIMTNRVNAPIGATITIGTDPPGICEGTYFAYDEVGDMLVVMVTYNESAKTYDWDEVVPGESAKFVYTTELGQIIVQDTCAAMNWVVPSGVASYATCPERPPACPPGMTLDDDLYMVYQTEGEGYIGSICCEGVVISDSYGWLSRTMQSVPSSSLMNKPTLVSLTGDMKQDTLYMVVAYAAKSNLARVTVTWLVVNVPYDDEFLMEDDGVVEVLPYVGPAPRQRNGTAWVYAVYEQTSVIDVTEADLAFYTVTNCNEECFKLDHFLDDEELAPTSMSVTVKVTMETYSLWQLYHDYGMMHSQVCQIWDINIDIMGWFAVCPAPERASSSSVPAYSSLLLALALICHLPALRIH